METARLWPLFQAALGEEQERQLAAPGGPATAESRSGRACMLGRVRLAVLQQRRPLGDAGGGPGEYG